MQSKEAGSLRAQEAIIIRLSFHATVRLPAADLSKNLRHLSKLFPIYFPGNGIQNKYKHVRLLDIYFYSVQSTDASNKFYPFIWFSNQSACCRRKQGQGGAGEAVFLEN